MSIVKFKNTHLDLGIIQPGSSHTIEWEYENGTPSDIIHTNAGCGACTRDLVVLNNIVQGVFQEQDSKSILAEPLKFKDLYSKDHNNLYTFQKTIDVYLKDDKPIMVPAAVGQVFNPEKKKIVLTFEGRVNLADSW